MKKEDSKLEQPELAPSERGRYKESGVAHKRETQGVKQQRQMSEGDRKLRLPSDSVDNENGHKKKIKRSIGGRRERERGGTDKEISPNQR